MIQSNTITPDAVRNSVRPSGVPAQDAQAALEHLMQQAVPIAYVAGIFPARSETFVYREVRELRQRGWDVRAVSLRDGPDDEGDDLRDLKSNRLIVYGSGQWKTMLGFLREWIDHPIIAARTIATALTDAIAPREPMKADARLRLLIGALAGIGLAGRLREIRTRHLHCHFAHAPTTVGMYAAMQLGVSFSFTGHANDLFQRRSLLTRKLERAAFVACISQWHRQWYRELEPADDSVYALVRCGVDTQSWTRPPKTLDESGVIRILTVCRLVPKKGVDSLLRAIATTPQWHLTVAGDGPQRQPLEQLAQELGVKDRVAFLGGVSNDQVRQQMQTTDLFALACHPDADGDRDGIPVVLIEAMACGVPVVAGDLPAIRELVSNGVSGLLADGANPASMAHAIRNLSTNPDLREKLSADGRAVVQREFGLDANISRLETMLEKCLSHVPQTSDPSANVSRRYALITPCRDEAKFARQTLDSIVRQSAPPALWVIVDDGSTDQTPEILAQYAEKYPFIRLVRRPDRGSRKLGGGVIDAFYAGYETLNPAEFDYVCKLDLDLELPPRYFESLMKRMEQNPRIGTCSGKPYFQNDGKFISEMCGDENSVGMIKFYRTECFRQIGGFVRELMWDGIDGHRCRMAGWIAVSWEDPQINFQHLRPMGSSDKNFWTGRVRHGVGQYFMGTGPLYMLASAMYRMTRRPWVVGGAGMFWGYCRSWWEGKPRYGDVEFRRFLRQYQRDCLLLGKRVATRRLNRRQAITWKPSTGP